MMARAMLPPPRNVMGAAVDSAAEVLAGIGAILPKHRVLHGFARWLLAAVNSRAEQGRPDTHQRGTLVNGLAKVIAHPHRERVERTPAGIQPLQQRAQRREQ